VVAIAETDAVPARIRTEVRPPRRTLKWTTREATARSKDSSKIKTWSARANRWHRMPTATRRSAISTDDTVATEALAVAKTARSATTTTAPTGKSTSSPRPSLKKLSISQVVTRPERIVPSRTVAVREESRAIVLTRVPLEVTTSTVATIRKDVEVEAVAATTTTTVAVAASHATIRATIRAMATVPITKSARNHPWEAMFRTDLNVSLP